MRSEGVSKCVPTDFSQLSFLLYTSQMEKMRVLGKRAPSAIHEHIPCAFPPGTENLEQVICKRYVPLAIALWGSQALRVVTERVAHDENAVLPVDGLPLEATKLPLA